MNVVIVGAAGFLGSHLAHAYSRNGHRVLGIDNFSSGTRQNLGWMRSDSGATFVEADIAGDGDAVVRAIEALGGANLVLHFASLASPPLYMRRPIETLRANSAGTDRCCALALANNARLVYASTSEIYGDPREHPQAETYAGNVNPVGPRSCYDEGKRFGEAMVTAYAGSRGLDARIVRIFNTYGPRMRTDDGRVIPAFLSAALDGRALPIAGDGNQTRSFCYVDDLVAGVMCAAERDIGYAPVNLGNPEEITIAQLATLVAEIAGIELRVERTELPVDDPVRRRPDISRARERLGWSPQVGLRDGLQQTWAALTLSRSQSAV